MSAEFAERALGSLGFFADRRELVAVGITDIGAIEILMEWPDAGRPLIDSAIKHRRSMEGTHCGAIRCQEGRHRPVADARLLFVEWIGDPEAAADIALRCITRFVVIGER